MWAPVGAGRDRGFDQVVTAKDFARAFGTDVDALSAGCRRRIDAGDFRYRIARDEERERIIADVLARLDQDVQRVGAEERQGVWHDGWDENLKTFEQTLDLAALVPKFIRPSHVIRFQGDYIVPASIEFEREFYAVLRLWLFETFLAGADVVFEFGCGTGFNLAELAQMYPQRPLVGLDFVQSSCDLVNKAASHFGWNVQGRRFDMRKPSGDLRLGHDSAVLTIGAIEQLANEVDPFLAFLLEQKPRVCLSVEPMVELYGDTLCDSLAKRFHRKRGYTTNYLARLRQFEAEGRIAIERVKRTGFGSQMMEGYSYVVWRVL